MGVQTLNPKQLEQHRGDILDNWPMSNWPEISIVLCRWRRHLNTMLVLGSFSGSQDATIVSVTTSFAFYSCLGDNRRSQVFPTAMG
jgi:hypothetical protein